MSHTPPLLPTDQDLSLAVSPSKALAHQRTTQSWSRVMAWLTTLFAPHPIPPFERNTATLNYLQSLMDANGRADYRQRLLHEAKVEQLRRYEAYEAATNGSPEKVLLTDLKGTLSQEASEHLTGMTKASVVLGCIPSSDSLSRTDEDITPEMGRRIIELTQELFRLQNELDELTLLRDSFAEERKNTEEEVSELREDVPILEDEDRDPLASGPSLNPASARVPLDTLLAQTTQFNTSTKQLTFKIKEYQDRIHGLNRSLEAQRQDEGDITIEEVQRRTEVVQQKKREVEEREAMLSVYHGLPPVLEASREEVRRAQGELEEWRRRREAAFERIGRA